MGIWSASWSRGEAASDCIFCSNVVGERLTYIVCRDERVTTFRDPHPRAAMHILLVPNHHVAGVGQVKLGDAEVLGRPFVVTHQLAEQEGVTDGYRLVMNNVPQGRSVSVPRAHVSSGGTYAELADGMTTRCPRRPRTGCPNMGAGYFLTSLGCAIIMAA